MSTPMQEPNENQPETVTVPVPGPRRIRRAARSVKRTTVAAATHPITVATARGTAKGVGIVGLAVISATAHGLSMGYAQNHFTGTITTRTAPLASVTSTKAPKVA